MSKKEPGRSLVEETGIGVVLASLAMLIAAPMFVYATDSAGTDGAAVSSQLMQSVADLKGQLTNLGSQFDNFSTRLDTLNSRVESLALSTADARATEPGVADCLATCRKRDVSCLTAGTGTVSPTANVASGAVSEGLRTTCSNQADSCINLCKAQTAVSCDTNCAVQLGACIRGAGSDKALAGACRTANEACLISKCVPQTINVGQLRAKVSVTLPSGTCQSQCARENALCRQSSRFDQSALDECAQVNKTCSQVVCQAVGSNKMPGVTSSPSSGILPKNIVCENSCTDTYYKCKQRAGSDETVVTECGTNYGTCRNQCLLQGGGGMGTSENELK